MKKFHDIEALNICTFGKFYTKLHNFIKKD